MDRINVFFWGIIAILFSASLFYGVNAEKQRQQLHHGGGSLQTGDIVRLEKVLDGDTVVVSKNGDTPATIRILGIKAFEAKIERDAAAPFGKAAIDSIAKTSSGLPIRVMLHNPPKDSRGRYLATLYVNDMDMALQLVRDGLVLVYSVYPFPAMPIYLQEQELARARKRGLWSNMEVKTRAIALIKSWQEQTQ